jgi:ribosome-binding ATPase YchF (GTP1/OBG family)
MPDEIPTQPVNGVAKYRQEIVEKDVAALERKIDELQKQINDQALVVTALKERLSIFAVAQSALTVIVGAVAAFIGASK